MMIRLPFGRALIISLKHIPTLYTFGITNRASNNLFVFFADYDSAELKVVEEEAKFFQQNYNMGPMLINVSSRESEDYGDEVGNYHLIGFKLFTFPEIKELISLARCDNNFKIGYRIQQQKAWVLRIGAKVDKKGRVVKEGPRPLKLIPSKVKEGKFSSGHILFFDTFCRINNSDIRIKRYFAKKYLEKTDIDLIDYVTK